MMKKDSAEPVHRIEITGRLDRHAVEALQLEIRRLTRSYGIDIKELRIEKVPDERAAPRNAEALA